MGGWVGGGTYAHTHVCMYVCTYAHTYVLLLACMHVCVCVGGWVDACMQLRAVSYSASKVPMGHVRCSQDKIAKETSSAFTTAANNMTMEVLAVTLENK